MNDSIYRRFIPIGTPEEMDRLKSLIEEKSLSHEDLKLILKTIKLNPNCGDCADKVINSLAEDFAFRFSSSHIPE